MKSGDLLLLGLGLLAITAGGAATVIVASALSDFSGDDSAFARSMFDLVGRVLPSLSVKGRLLIVAHAALESGWGSSGQNRLTSNNLFNITAGRQWGGPTISGTDVDKDNQPIAQNWRVYPSLEACVGDYWQFLGQLYPQAQAELTGNADAWAFSHALVAWARRYYELNEAEYSSRLAAVLVQVETYVGVQA